MTFYKEFKEKIRKGLAKDMGLSSLAVPVLKKIVINVGMADAKDNKGLWGQIEEQLTLISGQKPVRTKARKSISGFKLRAGDEVGLMVTLRGKRMYDFIEKLVKVVLPRVRDFRGLKLGAFDGQGNYSLGFSEQLVFAEIDPAKVTKIKGLEVIIVTSAKDDGLAKKLLKAIGMPFEKEK